MAARNFTQFYYGLEKKVVQLYATVDFNGSGAPTLKQFKVPASGGAGAYSAAPSSGFKGIKSITRSAQGKYVITLQDNYVRLLGMDYTLVALDGTTSALALNLEVVAEAVNSATPTITFVATTAANSSTYTDLGANDRVLFTITLSDSSAA